MNPGDYVGEDGRKVICTFPGVDGVECDCLGILVRCPEGCTHVLDPSIANWPKAKAALDALIESEQEEWVEVEYEGVRYRYAEDGNCPRLERWVRESNDPSDAAYFYEGYDPVPHYDQGHLGVAFRAGRKAALEQVQELVEAVLSHGSITTAVNGHRDFPDDVLVAEEWIRRIRVLAKAVKG